MKLQELNSTLFTWSRWRSGSIADFKIPCRYKCITSPFSKRILRECAVGYCDGTKLLCRPKEKNKAIMFFNEGKHFWTHFRDKEFKEVFDYDTN